MLINTLQASSLINKLTFSIGMLNTMITPGESTLDKNVDAPEGSVDETAPEAEAVISVIADYEFKTLTDKTYHVTTIFPMVSSDTAYYEVGYGVRYYFRSLSSTVSFDEEGSDMKISSKTKYFAGFGMGVGYLVYRTQFSKKSDVIFNLNGEGGAYYDFSDSLTFKLSLGISKGFGVQNSIFQFRGGFGLTYYVESLI